jgi:hypothetical protein
VKGLGDVSTQLLLDEAGELGLGEPVEEPALLRSVEDVEQRLAVVET